MTYGATNDTIDLPAVFGAKRGCKSPIRQSRSGIFRGGLAQTGTGRGKVEKTMTRVGFRIGTIGTAAGHDFIGHMPASEAWAMGWDGNFWSWNEAFSRSPEAVRGQLNALLKEFRQEEGGLKGIYFKRVDARGG